MSTGRLWAMSASVAAAVAILIAVLLATSGPSTAPDAASTASPRPTAVATPAPSATPAPEPTTTATAAPSPTTAAPTCEAILTEAYLTTVSESGRQTWNTAGQAIGARPFDSFPQGVPEGSLVCRSAASPDVATDDVEDRAWARIDPESGVAAMQELEASGYTRSDTADGVYLTLGPASYLFTGRDVRWAPTRAGLADIRPVSEIG